MDSLEYIDDYFTGNLTDQQKTEFQARIESDPAFSEEVAFYVNAISVLKEERRDRFRTLYKENRPPAQAPVRKIWPWLAAASVLLLALAIWLIAGRSSVGPERLADRYIRTQLSNLSVTMSSTQDTIQEGIGLYNEGRFSQALEKFDAALRSHPDAVQPRIYSGIVYLRLQDYDKAVGIFRQLEGDTTLYSNPALFYESLTLMKRNRPGDAEQARKLLQKIVDENLDNKEDAVQLLKNW